MPRDALRNLPLPDHAGLCYQRAAPLRSSDGKFDSDRARPFFDHLESLKPDASYNDAQQRWQESFKAAIGAKRALLWSVIAETRLLIGHGNPAPTEVGLTLGHTFGMPVLPGSGLKGLCAHYTQVVYGPDPDEDDAERDRFRGPRFNEQGRLVVAPGDVYKRLFGTPPSGARDDEDDDKLSGEDGDKPNSDKFGARGEVIFHDAWLEPGPPPLARDVLAVHQPSYYTKGQAPVDHESPIPVSFLTVRPGARFTLALTSDADDAAKLLDLAKRLLSEALEHWGVGGKTAAGYGRLRAVEARR